MAWPKRDAIRFLFDEDSRGFGLGLMGLRRDLACIGSPPLQRELPLGIRDPDWIPLVGGEGWVVITQNIEIRTHPEEAKLAVASNLRVACLVHPEENPDRWDAARMVLRHWDKIEQLGAVEGPAWLTIHASRTRRQNFQPGLVQRARPGRL
ncbi:hypothetical protein ACQEVB_11690 [Pseudonocardia sp. CA-107938]|uniref:PIN-like domain-containing protein n=1 Tax=Pseudonocardia sp. CA-107938 TaxID=3240021 RepID=UPI003D8E50E1